MTFDYNEFLNEFAGVEEYACGGKTKKAACGCKTKKVKKAQEGGQTERKPLPGDYIFLTPKPKVQPSYSTYIERPAVKDWGFTNGGYMSPHGEFLPYESLTYDVIKNLPPSKEAQRQSIEFFDKSNEDRKKYLESQGKKPTIWPRGY